MSKFKVGDKVRYKESEKKNAKYNTHDANTVYTVRCAEPTGVVWFVGSEYFCSDYRLELAPETQQETFDYKQALKILAENPEIELQYKDKGNDFWSPTKVGNVLYLNTTQNVVFQIKPSPKPTSHWLIKSKGKFAVTSGKYSSEEDVKTGYSYPVAVIQKLED